MDKFKKFWAYKVLPLVYDSSLSYLEVLQKLVTKINEVIATTGELAANVVEALKNSEAALNTANEAENTAQTALDSVPTKTSELTNDSGFVNETQAADAAPVQSVNGKTGDVDTLHYGVCDTAANVAEKTVSIPSVTSLTNGLRISVYFTYGTTSISNPTLKVNNLTAKPILKGGRSTLATNYFHEGTIIDFVYVITGWLIVGNTGEATTTYYGLTKLSSSTTSTSTTLAATASAVKAVKDAIPTKTSDLDNDSGFTTKEDILSWSNLTTTDTLAEAQTKLLSTPGYFRTWTYSGSAAYAPSNDSSIDYTFTAYARASDGINRLYFTAIDMTHGTMYIATPDGRWVEQQNLAVPVEIPSNSNLNDYTTPGTYTVTSSTIAATIANSPITDSGYRLWVIQITSGYFMQVAIPNTTTPRFWMRRMQPSASSYSSWTPQARMSDVPEKFNDSALSVNSPVSVTLPAGCKGYYLIIGTNSTHMGCGLINCTSTTAFHRKVLDAADVTVSTSGLNLIVTNTVTATTRLYVYIVSS